MVTAMRTCLDIVRQPALAPYVADRWLPDGDDDSDATLAAHARARSETIYHPTSTAAMGPADDDVCDPRLRVRGVDGLRVVDASVLPTVPRGNTNAPVIMVAERALDLIRDGGDVSGRPRALSSVSA